MQKKALTTVAIIIAGISLQACSQAPAIPEEPREEKTISIPKPAINPPQTQEESIDNEFIQEKEEELETEAEEKSETTTTEAHPISLPAISEQEFDGRDLSIISTLANNQWYTRYRISYKSGDLDISGIMNVPKGEGPFPILILNHGYIDPAVYTNGRGLKREQDYFARKGYIVIHPDYRNHAFSSKVEENHMNLRLGYTEDVINTIFAVKNSELEYFNKEKIGMVGHSMGGGITMNILVAKPDLIQAGVLYAPVSADYRQNFEKWTRRRDEQAAPIIEAYGEPDEDNPFWDNISPITFIDDISAPVMVQHGTADDSCPIEWSDNLATQLEEAGKDITYHRYEGAPHEFIRNWSEFMRRNTAFFDKHLKDISTNTSL